MEINGKMFIKSLMTFLKKKYEDINVWKFRCVGRPQTKKFKKFNQESFKTFRFWFYRNLWKFFNIQQGENLRFGKKSLMHRFGRAKGAFAQ